MSQTASTGYGKRALLTLTATIIAGGLVLVVVPMEPQQVLPAIAVGGVLIWGVVFHVVSSRNFRLVADRPDATGLWRARFPTHAEEAIQRFIDGFAEAFGIASKHQAKLRPDDRLLTIYQILHPPAWSISDCMEYELLIQWAERTYRVDPSSLLKSDTVTLADLFERLAGERSVCSTDTYSP